MRILITGAAGFLGSHLTDRFLADGYHVIGMDNLITGSLDNIAHLEERDDFRFREHDVTIPFEIDGDVVAALQIIRDRACLGLSVADILREVESALSR